MCDDSEDRLLTETLHDGTIITVRGSSEENVTTDSNPVYSDDVSMPISEEISGESREILPPVANSTDINTDDFEAFEEDMKNLNVTLPVGGRMVDNRSVASQCDHSDDRNDITVLYETCGMIQQRQQSNYPIKPPSSGLVDAETVSD